MPGERGEERGLEAISGAIQITPSNETWNGRNLTGSCNWCSSDMINNGNVFKFTSVISETFLSSVLGLISFVDLIPSFRGNHLDP
jgi:hypothetical protein